LSRWFRTAADPTPKLQRNLVTNGENKVKVTTLDTPVVDVVMSKGTATHFEAIVKAYAAFENAMNEYVFGPRAGSVGKGKMLRRRLVDLDQISGKAGDFARAQSGGDDHSVEAIVPILIRIAEFIRFWQEKFEILEGGEPVTISAGDVPRIFDKDLN
jgi:hypothetical protein